MYMAVGPAVHRDLTCQSAGAAAPISPCSLGFLLAWQPQSPHAAAPKAEAVSFSWPMLGSHIASLRLHSVCSRRGTSPAQIQGTGDQTLPLDRGVARFQMSMWRGNPGHTIFGQATVLRGIGCPGGFLVSFVWPSYVCGHPCECLLAVSLSFQTLITVSHGDPMLKTGLVNALTLLFIKPGKGKQGIKSSLYI